MGYIIKEFLILLGLEESSKEEIKKKESLVKKSPSEEIKKTIKDFIEKPEQQQKVVGSASIKKMELEDIEDQLAFQEPTLLQTEVNYRLRARFMRNWIDNPETSWDYITRRDLKISDLESDDLKLQELLEKTNPHEKNPRLFYLEEKRKGFPEKGFYEHLPNEFPYKTIIMDKSYFYDGICQEDFNKTFRETYKKEFEKNYGQYFIENPDKNFMESFEKAFYEASNSVFYDLLETNFQKDLFEYEKLKYQWQLELQQFEHWEKLKKEANTNYFFDTFASIFPTSGRTKRRCLYVNRKFLGVSFECKMRAPLDVGRFVDKCIKIFCGIYLGLIIGFFGGFVSTGIQNFIDFFRCISFDSSSHLKDLHFNCTPIENFRSQESGLDIKVSREHISKDNINEDDANMTLAVVIVWFLILCLI